MNLHDLNVITSAPLVRPSVNTSTVTGSAFDTQQYDGVFKVITEIGAVTGTAPTLDGKLQASADGSTGWTDISGATFAQATTANTSPDPIACSNRVAGSTVVGGRYIRYVGTIAGTTPSFTMMVEILGAKRRLG